jgi:2-polyprenyl-3-methyl-5-hydroxy-6-metoxy-1,4-benzoquinol methylase
MKLESTGERVIEEDRAASLEDYVIYMGHVATYRFAERFSHGKRVLDHGCGSGYGAALLAETAREVQAVDVDEGAIDHARQRFQRGNLTFGRIHPTAPLPFPDGAFETVVSFQVFEHVRNVAHYLSETRRVLEPGGSLLLATPDRTLRLLPLQKPWNRWHVREYSARTLTKVLSRFFSHVEVLNMSGRRDVIDIELHRFRKFKWLTLPATLPVVPDPLRVWLLNMQHRLRGVKRRPAIRQNPDFDESAFVIGPGLQPSLNLVAIART